MKDIILDILKYAGNVGFFPHIRVKGNEDKTQVLASDSKQTIILNAETKEPITDFEGDFGLGDLAYLKGVADFFNKEGTSVKVVTGERGGETNPEEIQYTNIDGSTATYRFMPRTLLQETAFLKSGMEYDVEISPRKDKIDEFAQLAGINADEEQFSLKTTDGKLEFFLGDEDAAGHRMKFVFEENVTGDILAGKKWPVKQVIAALRLASSGEATLKISNKGLLTVSIDSGLANYDIIIIANKK